MTPESYSFVVADLCGLLTYQDTPSGTGQIKFATVEKTGEYNAVKGVDLRKGRCIISSLMPCLRLRVETSNG